MLMVKVVPEQKMARFYEVHVQSTLLDSHAVVCTWGSIKNGYHRVRMIKTQTIDEAEKIAERIIQQKTKKGYVRSPLKKGVLFRLSGNWNVYGTTTKF